MAPKRLLLLTFEFPPFHGGVGTFCLEIANSAVEMGYDVTVLAPSYGKTGPHDIDSGFAFNVERFPADAYKAAILPRLVREILVRRNRFDEILVADWPFIIAMSIATRLVRLPPFRVFIHGTDALILKQGRIPRMIGAGGVLGKADAVVANSAYSLKLAQENHPSIASTRSIVALLGVGSYWFDPAGDARDVKQRLGIPLDRKIVLSVSRLDERKGHRHMIQAIGALDGKHRDQMVYVIAGRAGNPSYEAELKDSARKTGATVVFTGGLSRDDIRTLYSCASVFMLVGEERRDKIEGFGLVYLEAAAQGVPSIASPVGGVPEVVLDGETGFLVSEHDPSQTAQKLEILLDDEGLRKQLGTRAQERATTLTWRRCAELTLT